MKISRNIALRPTKDCIYPDGSYLAQYKGIRVRVIEVHIKGFRPFRLITSLLDTSINALEIVKHYHRRWDIEILFRFLKRTINGLHLMSHYATGIENQFTLYMIGYLLLLSFKQSGLEDRVKEKNRVEEKSCLDNDVESCCHYERGLVSLLGERLQKYWKIGIHWLTTVRNLLLEPLTADTRQLIWSDQ